jgi:hypothetical protein
VTYAGGHMRIKMEFSAYIRNDIKKPTFATESSSDQALILVLVITPL